MRGLGCREIAKALNNKDVRRQNGSSWTWESVRRVLTNPKYMGCNIWGQTSQKLRTRPVAVPAERWIVRRDSFPAIVAFCRVQQKLREYTSNLFRSDDEILRCLKNLSSLGQAVQAPASLMPARPLNLRIDSRRLMSKLLHVLNVCPRIDGGMAVRAALAAQFQHA
jgi:hypothetical protein